MSDIKREILSASYWEHFKFAKDLSLILPLEHPKRVMADKALHEIQVQLNDLNKTTFASVGNCSDISSPKSE